MQAIRQPRLGIILLAAGAADRMQGMPKQLLVHQRVPLVRHLTKLLLSTELPVCVVLGARHQLIAPVISDLPVKIVENKDWETGMGSSLQCGLRAFREYDGVLICVVDQPYLNRGVIDRFRTKFQNAEDAATLLLAARYANGRLGVPALFGSDWYGQLFELNPAYGARNLIRAAKDRVGVVNFPRGHFDLDRPEDWDTYREG